VLRATDGTHFSQVAQITSGKTLSYTDATAATNTSYQYEVQAYSGTNTSLASNVTIVKTPLAAPTALTATAQSRTSVQLNWTDNDSSATGYTVLRATDGVHFSQLGTISSSNATTYTDSTVVSGHSYSYEVNAFATGNVSAVSAVASADHAAGGALGFDRDGAIQQLSPAWLDGQRFVRNRLLRAALKRRHALYAAHKDHDGGCEQLYGQDDRVAAELFI